MFFYLTIIYWHLSSAKFYSKHFMKFWFYVTILEGRDSVCVCVCVHVTNKETEAQMD